MGSSDWVLDVSSTHNRTLCTHNRALCGGCIIASCIYSSHRRYPTAYQSRHTMNQLYIKDVDVVGTKRKYVNKTLKLNESSIGCYDPCNIRYCSNCRGGPTVKYF